jgi:hypothetical protein
MKSIANKIALELGYSKALFIGKNDIYEYYSLVMNDDNTEPMPTGLPVIVAVDNKGKHAIFSDIESLRILSRFDES